MGMNASVIVAAAVAPGALAIAITRRLGRPFPVRALVGGATIGPVVAILTYLATAPLLWIYLRSLTEATGDLLGSVRLDPGIASVVASPWFLAAVLDYVVVAPLTEEPAKYLGARLARASSRRDAFLAGIAAGVGFTIVEDALYALAAAVVGGPWIPVLILRATGTAVHPLASGLVALGWWDERAGRVRSGIRGMVAGMGIHAVWNAMAVALLVIGIAYGEGSWAGGLAGLVIPAALGAVLTAALWVVTASVARGGDPVDALRARSARSLAGWIVLAASLLVPVWLMVSASPRFRA
jgi:PrsW family intramembrane metalloprotease